MLERRVCAVCGSLESERLRSAAYCAPEVWSFLAEYYQGRIPADALGDARYEIRRCRACAFLWQAYHLDPDGMQRLYEEWISAEDSLAKKTSAEIELYDGYARELSEISRRLGRKPCQLALLDFGMGWGAWCRLAEAYGFKVTGVELSERRLRYARAQGLRAQPLLDASLRYDFINCHQVLEHLPDPRATLGQLAQALAAGGQLRVSVPDARGMAAALCAPGWRAAKDALHPLEHLNGFEPETLARLAASVGLRPAPAPRARARAASLRARIPGLRSRAQAPRASTTQYFVRAEP